MLFVNTRSTRIPRKDAPNLIYSFEVFPEFENWTALGSVAREEISVVRRFLRLKIIRVFG